MASSSSTSSSTYSNPPCAACKSYRRKCLPDCVFSPYFPPEESNKFNNVHRIFGASNVSKILNEIPQQQRDDAVNSLAYEAEARLKDPVFGCVGVISALQHQVFTLQRELDATNADILRFANNNDPYGGNGFGRRAAGSSGYFDPNTGFLLPYSNWGWNNGMNNSGERADHDQADN